MYFYLKINSLLLIEQYDSEILAPKHPMAIQLTNCMLVWDIVAEDDDKDTQKQQKRGRKSLFLFFWRNNLGHK